jgi:hypothetical protein
MIGFRAMNIVLSSVGNSVNQTFEPILGSLLNSADFVLKSAIFGCIGRLSIEFPR